MHQLQAIKSKPSNEPSARRDAQPLTAPVSEQERWMELQRGIGNQAVSRMLQRRESAPPKRAMPERPTVARLARVPMRGPPAGAAPCACGGSCPRCQSGHAPSGMLPMSTLGDESEQEADRAAVAVMNMGASRVASGAAPSVGAMTSRLQRMPEAGGGSPFAPPIVQDVLRSRGRPLDSTTKAFMEPRFGRDFGDVRVHTDARAAESARAVDARAYTVGRDVVFGSPGYAPDNPEDRSLLAHELAHTLQQRQRMPTLQRSTAGRCSDAMDVDEARDETKAVGRAAHEQIQSAFAAHYTPEVEIPRASKEGGRVGTRCPKEGTPNGLADLFGYYAGNVEIGEIKSIEGAAHATAQVVHYGRRVQESVDRLLHKKKPLCPGDPDQRDLIFDSAHLDGVVQKGTDPNPTPLTSFAPPGPLWLGPFKYNTRKQLYCEVKRDGGVLYWCTKKRRREDERKEPFKYVYKQAERRKERVKFTNFDGRYRELLRLLPPAYAPVGSRLVFAIPRQLFDGIDGAEQLARSQSFLRIGFRDRPVYAYRFGIALPAAILAAPVVVAALAVLIVEAAPLVIGSAAVETGTGVALETGAGAALETGAGAALETGAGAALETGAGAALETGAGAALETGAGAIEVIDLTASAATGTAAATTVAAEAIPLWMVPTAQAFAKQAALSIVAVLVGAGLSEDDANAAATAGLKNPHVFTVVDVTRAKQQPGIHSALTVGGEKFRVIGEMQS
jgi:hypothetical protein